MASRFSVEAQFKAIDSMTKPIGKMQRRINKFTRLSTLRFKKMAQGVAKVGARMGRGIALGTSVAGAAMTTAILKTATLGDEAAKTSRRLGITAETLQELTFAADRQGVSAGVLQSSFTALQKRVGELKSESGSLFSFLKKTGDKAFIRQLSLAKDTEEAFVLITERAETIEDPLKKAAFAAAAFSRSGIQMISFMEAGQDGIKKLREEARKYGAVISNEAAEQSELFIDSLTNLKSTLLGIGKTFSTKVIPFLSVAMQRFADFWALNKQIIGVGMDKFLEFIGKTFKAIKPGVVALFHAVTDLFSAFWEAVTSILPKFNTESDDLSKGINKLTAVLRFMAEIGVKAFEFITKISPFLKPFLTVLLAYQGFLLAIVLVTKGWAIVQGILNAILSANPISLIVIAVAALVAGIVLLINNWDMVVAGFRSGAQKIGSFFSNLLDSPVIAAAGLIFAPFLAIPALIIKHWEPITALFDDLWDDLKTGFSSGIDSLLNLIKPFQGIISSVGGLFEKFGITFNGNKDVSGNESEEDVSSESRIANSPQIITSSMQIKRSIEERNEKASAELLIRDESGRAELTQKNPIGRVKIAMAQSGGA